MRSNLTEFRKKLGLTLTEMAEIVGLATSTWCNIEKGRSTGTANMWIKLGATFELTLEELINLMEVK